jgi:DNA-binding response OmpR family regulator
MRVLIVEDEPRLAELIAQRLRREGMAVDLAGDGRAALAKINVSDYDAVVLDRDLPEVHGDVVCQRLTERERRPRVIMLTASSAVADRIAGLELGADDYLGKPFALSELVARLRALARRPAAGAAPILVRGDLVVDPARHTAERGGRTLVLRPKEFGVLEALLLADGRVISSEELLHKVWDENADPFTTIVRQTVMTLRRKLGEPQVLVTVPGAGYCIR